MVDHQPRRKDLLHPELSYRIIGVLFDVYNVLGPGHRELYYQRAVAEALKKESLPFQEQVRFPLRYHEKLVGSYFLDFLIDNKIILELKRGNRYSKRHIDQVLEYLRASKHDLAILASFGADGVTFKRIVAFGK